MVSYDDVVSLFRWINPIGALAGIVLPPPQLREIATGDKLTEGARDLVKKVTFAKYMATMNETWGVALLMVDEGFRKRSLDDFNGLKQLLWSGGFDRFVDSWKLGRQLVPLQGRLVMEQVLWDLGGPWRTLVSGFKPLDVSSRGSLAGTSGEGATAGSGSAAGGGGTPTTQPQQTTGGGGSSGGKKI